ncbi:hypothetical protein HYX13_02285 [Candidatus Woesearchaeota archaeon]|nr:hypothetical protein [Candidatus Woesearchaeota archaeon]
MNSLQSIVQKNLFSPLQRIFLSSVLALSSTACLPCYGNDSNCGDGEICVENACVLEDSDAQRRGKGGHGTSSAGVFSATNLTDAYGETAFSSSLGDFSFAVEDAYTGERIPETEVAFLQGEGFSLLTLGKSAYVQQLEIVLPETPLREAASPRTFSLMPAQYQEVTIFDYYFSSHQEKVLALNNYQQWAENAYDYKGCFTREELQSGRANTFYALAVLSLVTGFSETPFFKAISTIYGGILDAEELGILNTLPYATYKVYDPLNFTSPPLFEGITEGEAEEDCY